MTQQEELSDDQKKLTWLLGLEKETLANMAHQQSKIIERLQKAAKAQAVPCPNVNEAINNPMPRGYMLNMLVKFQKWRIGEDVRTLDETGLTPRSITLAIDWAIEQLDKSKEQTVPQWISVEDQLPNHDAGKWSDPVIALSDIGLVFRLSYCGGWQCTGDFMSTGSSKVTHWMPLPTVPEQNK